MAPRSERGPPDPTTREQARASLMCDEAFLSSASAPASLKAASGTSPPSRSVSFQLPCESAPSLDLDRRTVSRIEEFEASDLRDHHPGPLRKLAKTVSFPEIGLRAKRESDMPGATDGADERTGILGAESGGGRDYATAATGGDTTRNGATGQTGGDGLRRRRRRGDSPEDELDPPGEAWWKRMVNKYGSVELDNKGSVARDHLALERTFLAWLRTSLSFASIGIAITQLFRLNSTISASNPKNHLRQVGKPLGGTFIGISIVVLFIGFHRYFESQHYVIRGKFPASRGSILIVSIIAAALIIASFVVVLAIGGSQFEK